MRTKPTHGIAKSDPLQEDLEKETFDPACMKDLSPAIDMITELDADDPQLAEKLAAELKEALKMGPVKVMTADGSEEEVHVPSEWTGAMSGLPFAAQAGVGGMAMTFNIPHKIPITLIVSVKDEFALYETAQSVDYSMAVASNPERFDVNHITQNTLRLTWFIGFLKMATSRVRMNMKNPQADQSVAMMVSAEDHKAGIERAKVMLNTLDFVRERLEHAVEPLNFDGLITTLSKPQGNISIH